MGVAGLFTLAITSACLDAGQFLKMPRRLVKGVLRICCTGNPARSIIAESILRKEAGHRFKACSAGTEPSLQVNPLALEVLKQKGPARSGQGEGTDAATPA